MSEVAAVMVPVAALKAWAGNPRKNDPAVDEVAASIKRFGFGSPIIARQENGEVICGHTRLKAAIRLKLASVPVRYLDLSAEEAHAYALADNKLGEIATWDQVPLADAFRDLEKAQVDLSGLGWDGGELEKFLGHKPGGMGGGGGVVTDPDEDDLPEPPAVPVSKPGEVYELGPHRLVCGDSTRAETWDALSIPADALCFTSPPYNAGESAQLRGRAASGPDSFYVTPDKTDWGALMRGWTTCAIARCRVVICNVQLLAGNKVALLRWLGEFSENTHDVVVWDKASAQPAFIPGVLNSCYEFVAVLGKHGATRKIPGGTFHGTESNIVRIPPQRFNEFAAEHRATMPMQLPAWAFGIVGTAAGSVVVDPFCGTGTTIIAADAHGLVGVGIEKESSYCDVIRRRWTRYARANNLDAGPGALDG